jgi:hypothetical protein
LRYKILNFAFVILIYNTYVLLPSTFAVVSTFASDSEGWKVVDYTSGGPYTHPLDILANPAPYFNIGGNPNGNILWLDETPNIFYFDAPNKFLGDMSSAAGTNLTFDLLSDYDTWTIDPLVILVGDGGTTLVYPEVIAPTPNTWTHYAIPLIAANWRVGNNSGSSPTQTMFDSVLGSIEALRIIGETNELISETTHLDNVDMIPEPSALILLCAGVFTLCAYVWRRRKSAA